MDTTDATPGEKCEHAPETPSTAAALRGAHKEMRRLQAELARERESRKQAEAALRGVKSLVDSQIAYLQALAKNNDLSDHGTGKLAAFMNMLGDLSKPVQEPAERERGK